MRRPAGALLTAATLALIGGIFAAVLVVPPSADALPIFEFSSANGPVQITAAELGARRTKGRLEIEQAHLDATIARLQKTFNSAPSGGTYELQPDHRVLLKGGSPGYEIDPVAMKTLLIRALRGSRSNLKIPMRQIPASQAPSNAIVVQLQKFRLDLYKGSAITHQFPVGVGALRFPTPPGAYYVKSKAVNPTWRNPGSAWARAMPSYIGPGPRNPLGTRALRLDRGALVIHGTPQPWTIGTRASHGCIRMRRADVEALFELVPEGTPVFIVP